MFPVASASSRSSVSSISLSWFRRAATSVTRARRFSSRAGCSFSTTLLMSWSRSPSMVTEKLTIMVFPDTSGP